MNKRYRVASKTRFAIFVAISLLLFTSVMNFALGLNTVDSATIEEYTEVQVLSGDTLWSIADKYMDDNQDIRKSVYELCQINQISADQLYAGMTILVPATTNI